LKRKPDDPREKARRAALNALRKARRLADRAGVKLSDWEGEFLGSVEQRVKTYGRAFADPDKGAAGAPLSMMQGVKLKEIAAKAKGEKKVWPKRKGFRRRATGEAGKVE
jgi:hypothetical protein